MVFTIPENKSQEFFLGIYLLLVIFSYILINSKSDCEKPTD
jgi:hypothetical protein